MRTRYMNMNDYGVPPDDQDRLYDRCKSLDKEESLILFQCAISAAPGLEIAIYESLVSGKGYRTMTRSGKHIPAKEDDFYAYRRKTLATFYDRLRLFGRWKN